MQCGRLGSFCFQPHPDRSAICWYCCDLVSDSSNAGHLLTVIFECLKVAQAILPTSAFSFSLYSVPRHSWRPALPTQQLRRAQLPPPPCRPLAHGRALGVDPCLQSECQHTLLWLRVAHSTLDFRTTQRSPSLLNQYHLFLSSSLAQLWFHARHRHSPTGGPHMDVVAASRLRLRTASSQHRQ